jgi:site-specific DNA recombinase
MVHLRGVFADLERQPIRERTMEGLRRRVEAGGWPGDPPPYGYQVVDNPDGGGRRLEVQPDEAAVVRLAYTLIVEEGYTTGETAEELNRLGSTPRRSPE